MKNRFSIKEDINVYDWQNNNELNLDEVVILLNHLNEELSKKKKSCVDLYHLHKINESHIEYLLNSKIQYCNEQIEDIIEGENPNYIVKYDLSKKLLKELARDLDIEVEDNYKYFTSKKTKE